MKIHPVEHVTKAQIVAGRLAASILDGQFNEGEKLPSERDLMTQLDVSRATLREGLKILAENHIIEVKPGVGSFVRPIDRRNIAQMTELAVGHRTPGASRKPRTRIQPEDGEKSNGGPPEAPDGP